MQATYDLIIVGAGPAGMTAAIYGARANLKVLMLDRLAPGGAVINTFKVENYPGFIEINGAELAMKMFEQTQHLGVDMDYATVNGIDMKDNSIHVYAEEYPDPFVGKTLLVATGSSPRKLNIPGEEELAGKSISWCAICDGAKYRGQDVVVIGGGNSAIDEGIYLSEIVNKLTIITDFDLTGDPTSASYLRSLDNVEVYPYQSVLSFEQDEENELRGVHFADKNDLTKKNFVPCDGVFEYIGAVPQTEFLSDLGIEMDHGYILVDENMKTNIDRIFAAGDCCSKTIRQIATAINDGAIAAHKIGEEIRDSQVHV